MRDILRLSLTLAVVAVLSASLLTGIENLTGPIIREREEKEYREALLEFFTEMAEFETEEIEGDRFDVIYDQDGEIIGVMATVQTQGYEGAINYNLAVDQDGAIIGMRIISHSETPGIGDVITTEGFQEQFVGKGFEDPIRADEDVDTVTGATESTSSMIASIRYTVLTIGENFMGWEQQLLDISAVPDGIYQGSVDGTEGILTVEVEVVLGMIERIDIVEQNEKDTYFVEAYPLIPELIIEEQSLEIDVLTEASLSSERIVAAVQIALAGSTSNAGRGDDIDEGE